MNVCDGYKSLSELLSRLPGSSDVLTESSTNMEALSDTQWEVTIAGTGLAQSLLAL